MYSDGKSFFKRAAIFQQELKRGTYPNASTLAERAFCSRNTAQRTIDRLRDEHFLPVEYDKEQHGYYLTDNKFELPLLTPGKEELTALLLLRELAGVIDAADLQQNIDSLWYKYAAKNPALTRELEKLVPYFSSDLTMVGTLYDFNLLSLLEVAANGTPVAVSYRSPWLETSEKTYRGKVRKLHFSDGNLYMLFASDEDRQIVLNACFLKKLERLNYDPLAGKEEKPDLDWPHGFGIWYGEELHEIEVRIRPPGAAFFASQLWHDSQEDAWDGEVLVRKMKSALSRQLMARILSLGSLVTGVKPEPLRKMVLEDAAALTRQLANPASLP